MIQILAKDNDVILYRKELNAITGGITSTILLQQMIFRFVNNDNKAFYKFKEPCSHEKYKDGDSWCEELGFSKKEFDTAFKRLEDAMLVSKKTKMDRTTFYSVNIDFLEEKLEGIYLNPKRVFTKAQKGIYKKPKREHTKSPKGDLVLYTENTTENTTESTADKATPSSIISFYKDNISSKYSDIQEPGSFNQITLKSEDTNKMLIGLTNYSEVLKSSGKKPEKLFFFIRDRIYLDYQEVQTIVHGKNEATVPADLVGKKFIIDGEEIEFLVDGYLKIEKDWKVTKSENVIEMVNLVRGEK